MYPAYSRPVLLTDFTELAQNIAVVMKEELVQEIPQRILQSLLESDGSTESNSDFPGHESTYFPIIFNP